MPAVDLSSQNFHIYRDIIKTNITNNSTNELITNNSINELITNNSINELITNDSVHEASTYSYEPFKRMWV